jgi:tight adherence protein B
MTLVLLAIFIASATAALAVSFTVRDLAASKAAAAGIVADEAPPIALEPPLPTGRINLFFHHLIERTGSRMDGSLAGAIVAVFALLGCGVPLIIWDSLPAAGIGLILGAALPTLWWRIQGYRRFRAITRDLPDTLDLLADAVRTGRSFEHAVGMVAADTRGPLAEEFEYCAAQLRLGHSVSAVLKRMVRRLPLPEFKMFAVAVAVHRQTGGNLALLTDRLATAARDRQQFQGHLAAATASSRLSAMGLIIGAVVGVSALLYIEPEYMGRFMSNRLGPPLLTVAGTLLAIGIVWLWRVLRVKY